MSRIPGLNRIPIDINDPEGPKRSAWDRVTDATSVGFAWSMLVHGIILIVLAFIVMPQMSNRKSFVVFATDADDAVSTFDAIVDVSMDDAGSQQSTTEQTVELVTQPTDTLLPVSSMVEVKAPTDNVGKGEGKSDGDGSGGKRMRAPANAVRQGSFAAWTQPIPQFRGERPRAGDSPRPGQDYHIVIQLQLPDSLNRYRIGDLTGTVVGTDGYRLQLPNRTFFFNDEGMLEEATTRKSIPVIDNAVQLMVHVPGAKFAAVQDTITVSSRKLAERQTLELVFEQAKP